MPRFSVVIPLFNKADYIGATLDSVLAQTFADFEVVVVDDGSSDGGSEVVESRRDPRVRLVAKVNGGVSSARNAGIDSARGQYVAFLDADDLWAPSHLEDAAAFFTEHPRVRWYTSTFARTTLREVPRARGRGPAVVADYFGGAHSAVCSSSVVLERDLIAGTRFSEQHSHGEDLLFWFAVACVDPMLGVSPAVDVHYVLVEGSLADEGSLRPSMHWRLLEEQIFARWRELPEVDFKSPAVQDFAERILFSYLSDGELSALRHFLAEYRGLLGTRLFVLYRFCAVGPVPFRARLAACKAVKRAARAYRRRRTAFA